MNSFTLADLAAAGEAGCMIVQEVAIPFLRPGDEVFWAGRWREYQRSDLYRMKDNYKVFLAAEGFEGVLYFRRFDIPRTYRILRRFKRVGG